MRLRLVALALLCAALPAAALVIRADRDDDEYLELATRYAAAIALGSHGEGALIAPRWVLTSASVGRALAQAKGARLAIGGAESEVQAVLLPPPVREGDIALVLLRTAVSGVEPTPIYRESDERGKGLVIVGHGATGVVGAATLARDGRKRAAINTVDRADATTLTLLIKGPDEASDLQGAAAPGDEGAPAFTEIKGALFVAGVAHGPAGGAAPKAGEPDIYTRVSAFAPWIDEAMFRAAADEAQASTAATRRR